MPGRDKGKQAVSVLWVHRTVHSRHGNLGQVTGAEGREDTHAENRCTSITTGSFLVEP